MVSTGRQFYEAELEIDEAREDTVRKRKKKKRYRVGRTIVRKLKTESSKLKRASR